VAAADASGWGVRDLTVRYGSRVALENVSVDVTPGEVVALVGGDGAGKTTLLRVLAGAVSPSAGEVRAPGVRRLGFMPTTAGVWLDLTVDQNVEFVGAAHGLRGQALAARSDVLLGAAGLDDARSRLGRHLSGGMRQKLAFTLAMLHEPELLILDEPSTGVDPVSRVELWRMIALAAASGTAVIMATTYIDEAERASHVTVLDAGRVLLSGSPEEVLQSMPGHVRETEAPTERERAWRRGRTYREWSPGEPPAGAPRVADLEDAVVGAALAREASHD
jgi:ABC-2 type transport system ATP-binding protein